MAAARDFENEKRLLLNQLKKNLVLEAGNASSEVRVGLFLPLIELLAAEEIQTQASRDDVSHLEADLVQEGVLSLLLLALNPKAKPEALPEKALNTIQEAMRSLLQGESQPVLSEPVTTKEVMGTIDLTVHLDIPSLEDTAALNSLIASLLAELDRDGGRFGTTNERLIKIIQMRFGLAGEVPVTREELATKYRVSLGRVDQLLKATYYKLRMLLKNDANS